MKPAAWWEEHSELCTFARVLADAGAFEGAEPSIEKAVIYYFEKPWKYDDEHEEWVKRGRPDEVDLEDLGAAS